MRAKISWQKGTVPTKISWQIRTSSILLFLLFVENSGTDSCNIWKTFFKKADQRFRPGNILKGNIWGKHVLTGKFSTFRLFNLLGLFYYDFFVWIFTEIGFQIENLLRGVGYWEVMTPWYLKPTQHSLTFLQVIFGDLLGAGEAVRWKNLEVNNLMTLSLENAYRKCTHCRCELEQNFLSNLNDNWNSWKR